MMGCPVRRRVVLAFGVWTAAICLVPAIPVSSQAQVLQPATRPTLRQKVNDLIEEIVTAEVEVEVTRRQSKLIRMKSDISRVAVSDPSIVDFVPFGSREIQLIGKETGSTTVTLWMGGPDNSQLLTLLVTVTKDNTVDNKRRLEYSELEAMINELFPNSRIQLFPVADKLIVRGQARDEQESTEIMAIIRENAQGPGMGAGGGNLTSGGPAAQPFPDASTLPRANIINMMMVTGEKQVLLKVRIAELKRAAARSIGANFNFDIKEFMLTSFLSGGGNVLASGAFSEGSFNLVLSALMTNGTAKILAEPNLVTLSGLPATFLSGGEFPVPTVVGVGGAQAATTSFKGFGTALTFLPTVLDKDRIRLNVTPTFSSLNKTNSVNGIFGLDVRTVSTTVDLRRGQVLAVAGLLQEQQAGSSTRIPFLADIPLLGRLVSSTNITRDETELLILVTPELVHALEPDQAPSILPGMEVTEPNDLDFFIYGDWEGRPDCHHRSTVWPLYKTRSKRCGTVGVEGGQPSDMYYINGPFGYSE